MLANDIIENKLKHDLKKNLHFYNNIFISTFHCDTFILYILSKRYQVNEEMTNSKVYHLWELQI